MRHMPSIILLVSLLSCSPQLDQQSQGTSIGSIKGVFWDDFQRLFRSPRLASSRELADFISTPVDDLGQASRQSVEVKRSIFGRIIARKIVDKGGLVSDQIYDALQKTLSSQKCLGASCTRVFGVDASQVDKFMDDMAESAKKSEGDHTESLGHRQLILNSLERLKPSQVLGDLRKYWNSLRLKHIETEGTCAVPGVVAFGIRSNGPFRGPGFRTDPGISTIDYRKSGYMAQHQGRTNFCHIFSVHSILSHSPREGIKYARDFDVERTALAMWVEKLGLDASTVVDDEFEFLSKLVTDGHTVFKRSQASYDKDEIMKHYERRLFSTVKFFKQGGDAATDLEFLRSKGAILRDEQRPKMDKEALGQLTRKLTLARYYLVLDAARVGQSINRQDIETKIRPILDEIWSLHKKEATDLDPRTAQELKKFKLITVDSSGMSRKELGQKLLKHLSKYGPIYISAKSHATAAVAYFPQERLFWVTNSAMELDEPYVSISEDALIQNLDRYAYLAPL